MQSVSPPPSYLGQFNTLGKRERYTIIGILVAAFIFGLFATVSLSRQATTSTSITPTAYTYIAPTTAQSLTDTSLHPTINLTADTLQLTTGQTTAIHLAIDSGTLPVDAADFVLRFDPQYIKPVGVDTGDFFHQYPRHEVDDSGSFSISGVADLKNNTIIVPKGTGTIATFTIQALHPVTETEILFDTEKTVIASGGKNITGALPTVHLSIANP